ncbi:MAG TPA: hypothetical protein VF529_07775 [Solirubrobacteraceae bacterium]|jgi:hypothetical protein
MPTRIPLALLAILALVATSAPAASAAAPPKGKYGCTVGGIFGGNLFILSKNRYRVDKSKVGKFRSKGKKLTFPSGVYKGLYRGRWYKTNGGGVEIALRSLESGFESTYCDLEKRG